MTVGEWREELRAAEAAIDAAVEGLTAAKDEVRGRQKKLNMARQRRAEILRAFISGESQLPLFDDRVEDGGPATIVEPFEPDPAAVLAVEEEEEAVAAGLTRAPRPGESEFDRELRASLHNTAGWAERWAAVVTAGLTDADLTKRIGEAYGIEGSSSGPNRQGHRYAGGSKPRFWFGGRFDGRGPDLQGAALRDRVRALLGIPKPTDAGPADWAATPLNMVVIREDLLGWLGALDLHTLGDLADACSLCGSLKLALDDWTPANVAAVEHDVRTWSSRRPGFPLESIDPPIPHAPSANELRAALASAVDAGDVAAWRPIAKGGYDHRAIQERLAGMWPSQPTYFEPVGEAPGFTVRGGDRPAFWVGHARPNASAMCRSVDLMGAELFAAVGFVLEAAAKKKAAKKKPTAAEARP